MQTSRHSLVLGTRGSRLALLQARLVADTLRRLHPGLDVQIEVLESRGDRVVDEPLDGGGSDPDFTVGLERALLDGRFDMAVHSLTDLPPESMRGLVVAAVPRRGDRSDALVLRRDLHEAMRGRLRGGSDDPLATLPGGAVVGTSSLRRRAQLLTRRPDLRVVDITGTVQTRLDKLDEGLCDGLILASACLELLQMSDRIHSRLLPPWMGAPAQGAQALQCRVDDVVTRELLQPLDHRGTRIEVEAERAVQTALLGAAADVFAVEGRRAGARLELDALLIEPSGAAQRQVRVVGEATRDGAGRVARRAARQLLGGSVAVTAGI